MNWFFTPVLHAAATPAHNPADEILVEPNARGGWSLRFTGDAPDEAMGNYPTADDAARVARLNVTHVRIVDAAPTTAPTCSHS